MRSPKYEGQKIMATGKKSLRERVGRLLGEFKENPQSVGFLWRLNLSDILLDRMSDQACTQKQLADKAGMKQPFVSRIINSDSNCTFDVAGRLLFALGIREGEVVLAKVPSMDATTKDADATASVFTFKVGDGAANEQITGREPSEAQSPIATIGPSPSGGTRFADSDRPVGPYDLGRFDERTGLRRIENSNLVLPHGHSLSTR